MHLCRSSDVLLFKQMRMQAVLFMLGPGSALEDAHVLVQAFRQLAEEKSGPGNLWRDMGWSGSPMPPEESNCSSSGSVTTSTNDDGSWLNVERASGSSGSSSSMPQSDGQPDVRLSPRDALFASTSRCARLQRELAS